MRVYFWEFTTDRYIPAVVPEHATVEQVLKSVAPQILAAGPRRGQVVLNLMRTGEQLVQGADGRYIKKPVLFLREPQILHRWQTLSQAGVFENEVLCLTHRLRPGAEVGDLDQRLAEECRLVKEMASKSDLVEVEAVEGNPPRRYRVTLKCKGLMLHPVNKKPCLTARHVLDIYLPAGQPGYPNEKPIVRCLTPNFHPNISPDNNLVCIGKWDSSLDIAWLINHIADMVTYRIYDFNEPFNLEAVKWAQENENKLPVDTRSLYKEPSLAASREAEADISFDEPITLDKGADRC